MITSNEFRSLDLRNLGDAFNRDLWLKPHTYDSEWLGGYYEEPIVMGMNYPGGVFLHYGKRTGIKKMVAISLRSQLPLNSAGPALSSKVDEEANDVMSSLGLPAIIGKTASNPVSFWKEKIPDAKGSYFDGPKVNVVVLECDGLLVDMSISKSNSRYTLITIHDLELVSKNCKKSEQEETIEELRHPNQGLMQLKSIENW